LKVVEYGLAIHGEIEHALKQLGDESCDRLIEMILQAKRIFLTGKGRSGLVMRMFAMRLMQMGFSVHVVGETTTPAIEKGDILIVGSGSGETESLVAMVGTAKALHAGIALVTTEPRSSIGKTADLHLQIQAAALKSPSTPNNPSVQPRGSLFEQSMLVVFEAIVLRIAERRGMDSDQMLWKHANLE
jgi:6-phospho-3-hexuloisomerase